MHSSLSRKFRSVARIELAIAAGMILLVGILLFTIFPHEHKSFASVEVQFTDMSQRGLAIVPASCPSTPHFAGQCDLPPTCSNPALAALFGIDCNIPDPVCRNGYILQNGVCVPPSSCPDGYTLQGGICIRTSCPIGYTLQSGVCVAGSCNASYQCSGNDLYYLDNSCNTSLVQSCSWGCVAGGCLPPPPPSYVAFGATNSKGNFSANGHLQVKPSLLRSRDTTQVYWNVANASSCTVTGDNGDSWTGGSSGAAGQTSSPILGLTKFTLYCASIPGATPSSITESVTVKVVPSYQEI